MENTSSFYAGSDGRLVAARFRQSRYLCWTRVVQKQTSEKVREKENVLREKKNEIRPEMHIVREHAIPDFRPTFERAETFANAGEITRHRMINRKNPWWRCRRVTLRLFAYSAHTSYTLAKSCHYEGEVSGVTYFHARKTYGAPQRSSLANARVG